MKHRTLSQGSRALLGCVFGLALSACATTPESPLEAAAHAPAVPPPVAAGRRDLTPEEKQVIVNAVSATIKDPTSAHYRWAKFHAGALSGSNNYCAMVNAKSQYQPYSGWQAYVVSVNLSNGRISSAVVGAIAGGKDIPVIRKICQRYGLDPNDAV